MEKESGSDLSLYLSDASEDMETPSHREAELEPPNKQFGVNDEESNLVQKERVDDEKPVSEDWNITLKGRRNHDQEVRSDVDLLKEKSRECSEVSEGQESETHKVAMCGEQRGAESIQVSKDEKENITITNKTNKLSGIVAASNKHSKAVAETSKYGEAITEVNNHTAERAATMDVQTGEKVFGVAAERGASSGCGESEKSLTSPELKKSSQDGQTLNEANQALQVCTVQEKSSVSGTQNIIDWITKNKIQYKLVRVSGKHDLAIVTCKSENINKLVGIAKETGGNGNKNENKGERKKDTEERVEVKTSKENIVDGQYSLLQREVQHSDQCIEIGKSKPIIQETAGNEGKFCKKESRSIDVEKRIEGDAEVEATYCEEKTKKTSAVALQKGMDSHMKIDGEAMSKQIKIKSAGVQVENPIRNTTYKSAPSMVQLLTENYLEMKKKVQKELRNKVNKEQGKEAEALDAKYMLSARDEAGRKKVDSPFGQVCDDQGDKDQKTVLDESAEKVDPVGTSKQSSICEKELIMKANHSKVVVAVKKIDQNEKNISRENVKHKTTHISEIQTENESSPVVRNSAEKIVTSNQNNSGRKAKFVTPDPAVDVSDESDEPEYVPPVLRRKRLATVTVSPPVGKKPKIVEFKQDNVSRTVSAKDSCKSRIIAVKENAGIISRSKSKPQVPVVICKDDSKSRIVKEKDDLKFKTDNLRDENNSEPVEVRDEKTLDIDNTKDDTTSQIFNLRFKKSTTVSVRDENGSVARTSNAVHRVRSLDESSGQESLASRRTHQIESPQVRVQNNPVSHSLPNSVEKGASNLTADPACPESSILSNTDIPTENNEVVVSAETYNTKVPACPPNTTSSPTVCIMCKTIWNDLLLSVLFLGTEPVTVNSKVTYGAIIRFNNYAERHFPVEMEEKVRCVLDRAGLGQNIGSLKISEVNNWIGGLMGKKKISCCDVFDAVYDQHVAKTIRSTLACGAVSKPVNVKVISCRAPKDYNLANADESHLQAPSGKDKVPVLGGKKSLQSQDVHSASSSIITVSAQGVSWSPGAQKQTPTAPLSASSSTVMYPGVRGTVTSSSVEGKPSSLYTSSLISKQTSVNAPPLVSKESTVKTISVKTRVSPNSAVSGSSPGNVSEKNNKDNNNAMKYTSEDTLPSSSVKGLPFCRRGNMHSPVEEVSWITQPINIPSLSVTEDDDDLICLSNSSSDTPSSFPPKSIKTSRTTTYKSSGSKNVEQYKLHPFRTKVSMRQMAAVDQDVPVLTIDKGQLKCYRRHTKRNEYVPPEKILYSPGDYPEIHSQATGNDGSGVPAAVNVKSEMRKVPLQRSFNLVNKYKESVQVSHRPEHKGSFKTRSNTCDVLPVMSMNTFSPSGISSGSSASHRFHVMDSSSADCQVQVSSLTSEPELIDTSENIAKAHNLHKFRMSDSSLQCGVSKSTSSTPEWRKLVSEHQVVVPTSEFKDVDLPTTESEIIDKAATSCKAYVSFPDSIVPTPTYQNIYVLTPQSKDIVPETNAGGTVVPTFISEDIYITTSSADIPPVPPLISEDIYITASNTEVTAVPTVISEDIYITTSSTEATAEPAVIPENNDIPTTGSGELVTEPTVICGTIDIPTTSSTEVTVAPTVISGNIDIPTTNSTEVIAVPSVISEDIVITTSNADVPTMPSLISEDIDITTSIAENAAVPCVVSEDVVATTSSVDVTVLPTAKSNDTDIVTDKFKASNKPILKSKDIDGSSAKSSTIASTTSKSGNSEFPLTSKSEAFDVPTSKSEVSDSIHSKSKDSDSAVSKSHHSDLPSTSENTDVAAAKANVIESSTTESEDSDSVTAKPEYSASTTAESTLTSSPMAESIVTDSSTANCEVTDSPTVISKVADSPTTNPRVSDTTPMPKSSYSITVDFKVTDSSTAKSNDSDSTTAESEVTNSTTVKPINCDSATAKPENTDSATAELENTDSATAELENTDLATAKPNNSDPTTASPKESCSTTDSPKESYSTTDSPEVGNSTTAEGEVTDSAIGVTDVADTTTARPEDTELCTTKSNISDSATAKTGASASTTASPKDTESITVSTKDSDSTTAKPKESDSTTAKPKDSDSTTAKPKDSDSTTAKPKDSDSTTAKPKDSDSTANESDITDLPSAKPEDIDSTSTKPEDGDSTTDDHDITDSDTDKSEDTDSTTSESEVTDSPTAKPNDINSITDESGVTDLTTAKPKDSDLATPEMEVPDSPKVAPKDGGSTTIESDIIDSTTATPEGSDSAAEMEVTDSTRANPKDSDPTTAESEDPDLTAESEGTDCSITASPEDRDFTTAKPKDSDSTTDEHEVTDSATAKSEDTDSAAESEATDSPTARPKDSDSTTVESEVTNSVTAKPKDSDLAAPEIEITDSPRAKPKGRYSIIPESDSSDFATAKFMVSESPTRKRSDSDLNISRPDFNDLSTTKPKVSNSTTTPKSKDTDDLMKQKLTDPATSKSCECDSAEQNVNESLTVKSKITGSASPTSKDSDSVVAKCKDSDPSTNSKDGDSATTKTKGSDSDATTSKDNDSTTVKSNDSDSDSVKQKVGLLPVIAKVSDSTTAKCKSSYSAKSILGASVADKTKISDSPTTKFKDNDSSKTKSENSDSTTTKTKDRESPTTKSENSDSITSTTKDRDLPTTKSKDSDSTNTMSKYSDATATKAIDSDSTTTKSKDSVSAATKAKDSDSATTKAKNCDSTTNKFKDSLSATKFKDSDSTTTNSTDSDSPTTKSKNNYSLAKSKDSDSTTARSEDSDSSTTKTKITDPYTTEAKESYISHTPEVTEFTKRKSNVSDSPTTSKVCRLSTGKRRISNQPKKKHRGIGSPTKKFNTRGLSAAEHTGSNSPLSTSEGCISPHSISDESDVYPVSSKFCDQTSTASNNCDSTSTVSDDSDASCSKLKASNPAEVESYITYMPLAKPKGSESSDTNSKGSKGSEKSFAIDVATPAAPSDSEDTGLLMTEEESSALPTPNSNTTTTDLQPTTTCMTKTAAKATTSANMNPVLSFVPEIQVARKMNRASQKLRGKKQLHSSPEKLARGFGDVSPRKFKSHRKAAIQEGHSRQRKERDTEEEEEEYTHTTKRQRLGITLCAALGLNTFTLETYFGGKDSQSMNNERAARTLSEKLKHSPAYNAMVGEQSALIGFAREAFNLLPFEKDNCRVAELCSGVELERYLTNRELLALQGICIHHPESPDVDLFYQILVQILIVRNRVLMVPNSLSLLLVAEKLRRDFNRSKRNGNPSQFLAQEWDEKNLYTTEDLQLSKKDPPKNPTVRHVLSVFCLWKTLEKQSPNLTPNLPLPEALEELCRDFDLSNVDKTGLCVRLYAKFCHFLYDDKDDNLAGSFLNQRFKGPSTPASKKALMMAIQPKPEQLFSAHDSMSNQCLSKVEEEVTKAIQVCTEAEKAALSSSDPRKEIEFHQSVSKLKECIERYRELKELILKKAQYAKNKKEEILSNLNDPKFKRIVRELNSTLTTLYRKLSEQQSENVIDSDTQVTSRKGPYSRPAHSFRGRGRGRKERLHGRMVDRNTRSRGRKEESCGEEVDRNMRELVRELLEKDVEAEQVRPIILALTPASSHEQLTLPSSTWIRNFARRNGFKVKAV